MEKVNLCARKPKLENYELIAKFEGKESYLLSKYFDEMSFMP